MKCIDVDETPTVFAVIISLARKVQHQPHRFASSFPLLAVSMCRTFLSRAVCAFVEHEKIAPSHHEKSIGRTNDENMEKVCEAFSFVILLQGGFELKGFTGMCNCFDLRFVCF